MVARCGEIVVDRPLKSPVWTLVSSKCLRNKGVPPNHVRIPAEKEDSAVGSRSAPWRSPSPPNPALRIGVALCFVVSTCFRVAVTLQPAGRQTSMLVIYPRG